MTTNDILGTDEFSPLQRQVMLDLHRRVVLCCGRRVGKSWIGSRIMLLWLLGHMADLASEVAAGRRPRWIGEGMRPAVAKNLDPDSLWWVVAPREEHLVQIKSYMLQILSRTEGQYEHPHWPGYITDHGRRLWLWLDGVCGRIDFIPANSQKGMVGRGLRGCWVDEAGLLENQLYTSLAPTLWEHEGRLLATGTPSVGTAHWFSRMATMGLEATHERVNDKSHDRDPDTVCYIANTIEHAALEVARKEAALEARLWGDAWAAQWIYADWRITSASVFREWSDKVHVVEAIQGMHAQKWFVDGAPIHSNPDKVWGVVDWSGGENPGALVIAASWQRNPFSADDTRPFVLVLDDYEGLDPYSQAGWFGKLHQYRAKWGVTHWVADPHSPNLIRDAKKHGIPVRPGAHHDKAGRVAMVDGLLHHSKGIKPALMVATQAEHTRKEMAGLKWQRNRDGEVTDKVQNSADHCVDCLCMLAAEVCVFKGTRIGGQSFF